MGNSDQERMTKQTLIEKLRIIIDTEMEKPVEEIDDSLVAECADFLMDLEGKDRLSDDEIKCRVKEIPFKNPKIIKHRRTRKALLIAACIAALILISSAIAVASNYNVSSFSKNLGHILIKMAGGEKLEIGNRTIIKNHDLVWYASIDELLAQGSLHVLYPTVLPNNGIIADINLFDDELKNELTFITYDRKTGMSVEFGKALPSYVYEGNGIAERIGQFDCYTISCGTYYQSVFCHGGDLYTVYTPNYDDIKMIIENLKES